MLRSIVFATSHLDPVRRLAPMAEDLGYHRVWLTEYPDRDALVRAAVIAGDTSTLRIGTGIAYSFTRHPLALAAAALDVHEASGGRFALGLGTGTKGQRQRWYGVPPEKPLPRMRETVELVRSSWASAGSFSYQGTFLSAAPTELRQANRSHSLPPLQIMGSGLGSAMLRAASSWCDGLLVHPLGVSEGHYRSVLAPSVAGRPDLWLAQWVITAIHPDLASAQLLARRALAFYMATPTYAWCFEEAGFGAAASALASRMRKVGPRWSILAELVPKEMVPAYCLCSTPTAAGSELSALESRLAARGVREVVLQVAVTGQSPADTYDSLRTVIESCAP